MTYTSAEIGQILVELYRIKEDLVRLRSIIREDDQRLTIYRRMAAETLTLMNYYDRELSRK